MGGEFNNILKVTIVEKETGSLYQTQDSTRSEGLWEFKISKCEEFKGGEPTTQISIDRLAHSWIPQLRLQVPSKVGEKD